ncbi:MAG: hypothetical protein KKA60_06600, partial [Proteobacteria bacterium]|nr:hypothetical protein [Pseudomonadota bacterium]
LQLIVFDQPAHGLRDSFSRLGKKQGKPAARGLPLFVLSKRRALCQDSPSRLPGNQPTHPSSPGVMPGGKAK